MKQLVLLLAVALLLIGCGGGGVGKSTVTASKQGQFSLSVAWPARNSRLIPTDANDVRFQITLQGASTPTQDVWVSRPAGNNAVTSTVYSQALLPGTYSIQADAFQSATGTGSSEAPVGASLSTGTVSETVVAGQATTFSVTLNSTLTYFAITGLPFAGDSNVHTIWVDQNGKLITDSSTNPNPSSIPIDYTNLGSNTINVVPESESPAGPPPTNAPNVLLLTAPNSGQTTLQTVTVSHPGAGIVNISGGTTTPGQFSFTETANGATGTDAFTITYTDGTTLENFNVNLSATASSNTVHLRINDTPPDFDAGGALVSATAQLTEIDSGNNVIQVFNPQSVPSYGSGTVTFDFGTINNTPNKFWFTYTLNLITTGGAAVPVVTYTSPATYATAMTYPGGGLFTDDAASSTTRYLPLSFPSPTGASVTPAINAATFSTAAQAMPLNVTAKFGSVTDTFAASLFTETPATNTSLFSFSSSTGNVTTASTLPLSLSNALGTITLGYQVRSGNVAGPSSVTGTFNVNILPTAGTGSITIQ